MANIKIIYMFDYNQLDEKKYVMEFDENSMRFIGEQKERTEEWVKLENNICKVCPYNRDQIRNCPVAANLAEVADKFAQEKSYRETVVGVITAERSYMKKVSLQEGLFSIFGLIMSTSGCPHMDFLRPMARFHLPFASASETIVRSLSMYLLRQYFRYRRGESSDFELAKLEDLYGNVASVNLGIMERIRTIASGDADKNAIVALDAFGSLLAMQTEQDLLSIEELLFDSMP